MAAINISIINASSVVSDAAARTAIKDLQTQVTRDWYPVWGTDAHLEFLPRTRAPPADNWWIVILDDTEMADALGYHDLTPSGLPIGKVFAARDRDLGTKWSVTLSHELLEMLGDPDINLTVLVQDEEDDTDKGWLYAYEVRRSADVRQSSAPAQVCDACEDDEYAYKIGKTWVSDFVYPAWFESFRPPGAQFDHGGHIDEPLQLLPGGYIPAFDLHSGHWQEIIDDEPVGERGNGSRRDKRRRHRASWRHSQLAPPPQKGKRKQSEGPSPVKHKQSRE